MFIRNFGIIIVLIMITSCTSAPKIRYVDRHDPIVDHNSKVALLVDVCNQLDVIGEDDYYIIDESKEIASAVVDEIQTYLKLNGISVQTEIIPFVCGAFDSPKNLPVKVAQNKGDSIDEASKPFSISAEFKDDVEYLNALTTLSTYVFERGMVKYLEDSNQKKKKSDESSIKLIVHDNQFREAVEVVKDRLNVSSLLYVGTKGYKASGAKSFFQGLTSFTVGMVTAVATAGLDTGYYSYYGPGFDSQGLFETAGLINLETKELSWLNYLQSGFDPLAVQWVVNPDQIGLLLDDLIFVKEPIE